MTITEDIPTITLCLVVISQSPQPSHPWPDCANAKQRIAVDCATHVNGLMTAQSLPRRASIHHQLCCATLAFVLDEQTITTSPKHADNENNRNHHNDEQRDDALREIRIFRHCLVPLNPAD